ncbi:MAG TPA: VCBS repeat-containing protein, partial [Pyrinomonadaceae bacterium]|nr:VCBS repeat-containing protein [Pyrinomonadaceae bacterium]
LAVFRPSNATYYLLQSSNGQIVLKNWGLASDERFAADYDGDGKTDLAVTRATSDSPPRRIWHILNSSNGAWTSYQWGLTTDTLVPADYNGDGRAEPAIFRPSDQRWYVPPCALSESVANKFGTTGDVPAILSQN